MQLSVIGIDEAGRGALAGPVVAAAVQFRGPPPPGLTDSKQLTRLQREALFERITTEGHCWSVGIASAEEVDAVNVLQATFLAMRRAHEALDIEAEVIVDGNQNPTLLTSQAVSLQVKADLLVPAVSAASIVAKVTRDRLMAELSVQHPGYGFELHAGYGVPAHHRALKALGPCGAHRKTFKPVRALWERQQ